MKKLLCFCGVFVLLFLSCTTSVKTVFDDSIPLEETAWICMTNVGTVTGYNDIPVRWKGSAWAAKMIQIPAGDTLLEMDINARQGNTIFTGKNQLFRYNFQPQKQYFFAVGREGGSFGLNVYELNMGENANMSKKYLVGFFSFNSNRDGSRTILN